MKSDTTINSMTLQERVSLAKKIPDYKIKNASVPKFLEDSGTVNLLKKSMSITEEQIECLYSHEFLEYAQSEIGADDTEQTSFNKGQIDFETIVDFISKINGSVDFKTDYGIFLFSGLLNRISSFCDNELNKKDEYYLSKDLMERVVLSNVLYEVRKILNSTLTYEANIAIKNDWLSLQIGVSEVQSYCHLLLCPEYQNYLLEKYPLISRKVEERIAITFNAIAKLFNRLMLDKRAISQFVNIDLSEIKIKDITRGEGDSHHGADSVTTIEFRNLNKLIYKPRSVSTEKSFQSLLSWINKETPYFGFKTTGVLDKGSYGWMEFVEYEKCKSVKDIKKFYLRYGGLIALTHMLRGTDFHFENIIANGSQPVLIDLETIIQPLKFSGDNGDNTDHIMGMKYLNKSVFYTALVDLVNLFTPLSSGSPLFAAKANNINYSLNFDCENQSFATKKDHDVYINHLPSIEGENINFSNYADNILDGFESCYRFLIVNKRTLIADNLLFELFGHNTIRVVLRYTSTYIQIIEALNSSYALRHFSHQDEYLFKLLLSAKGQKAFTDIANSEQEDSMIGDVPYFYSNVCSKDLVSSTGKTFSNVLAEDGFQGMLKGFASFNNNSLKNELLNLKYSLNFGAKVDEQEIKLENNKDIEGISFDIYEAISGKILIENSSYIYIEPIQGLDLQHVMKNINDDLYTGASGIAFSLAYAGKYFNSNKYSSLSRDIADSIITDYNVGAELLTGICNGIGSHIYTLSHLGHLWSDKFYITLAESYAEQISLITFRDRYYDLFFGSAGAILALLSLYSVSKSERILEIASQCGQHLIKHAESKDGVLCWKSNSPSNGYATSGFAHGSAGILFALLQLHKATNDNAFLDVVVKGEKYLQKCFDPSNGNWFESAEENGNEKYVSEGQDIWCHGAPGIGLFYYELNKVQPSIEFQSFVNMSQSVCIGSIPYENDSICHGTLGNLELPLEKSLSTSIEDKQVFETTKSKAFSHILNNTPSCGTESQIASLALFTGYSGIAYQALRLKSKDRYPSILTFAPAVKD